MWVLGWLRCLQPNSSWLGDSCAVCSNDRRSPLLRPSHTHAARVLTPIQRARMVALSKPLLPDFVLIATGAMRHHGLLPRALLGAAAATELASLVPVAHPLAAHA